MHFISNLSKLKHAPRFVYMNNEVRTFVVEMKYNNINTNNGNYSGYHFKSL